MILRISELKMRPDHTRKEFERELRKILQKKDGPLEYEIMRRSIDARKKPDLFYVYTVDVKVEENAGLLKKIKTKKVAVVNPLEYQFPYNSQRRKTKNSLRPVVVGCGPAGLFCALMLARSGLCPILLERGEPVEQRMETVNRFWKDGIRNPDSNVQFGEGGAGTFSDGKLNTMIKDPDGRIRFVLKEFVRAGADPVILYDHKPHIGTDVLVNVVRNIREEIIALGGEVRFDSTLTGITALESGSGYSLAINGQERAFTAEHVVLALGHSARDTFFMLYKLGLPMQAKAFAVGFRMEHSQEMINEAMYGKNCPYELGAAPYKVTYKCENGRGVYSFCMCPGGYVVNASSEEGMTAVNGMSYSSRSSTSANSAIVVTVTPEDYSEDLQNPLAGIAFQRRIERAAYECGNGSIPVQRFGDFCESKKTELSGTIISQCKGRYEASDLRKILPEELNVSLIEGIHGFARRIRGFDDPDALLLGVESRTSSPVRILRGDNLQSSHPDFTGIYPCGEGAGYAGGITSAAIDGIRVAEAVCAAYQ